MRDLPSSVQVVAGRGGLDVVRVTSAAATAEIYLHGAQVTAWAPTGAAPVLWTSRSSRFTAATAIRGGIPICFPWFGAHASVASAPAHGFARLKEWGLVGAHEAADDIVVTLGLADDEETRRSPWPHPFEAVCTVTVGSRLQVALAVTNRDVVGFSFEEALHTYLAVDEVRDVDVTGLEGVAFVDRLQGPAAGEPHPIRFTHETDRIYLGTGAPVVVREAGSGRSVTVAKDGSDATVVWNPWSAKARAMTDFGDDEWRHMVCVETCNIRDAAVHLAPGETRTMTTVLEVSGG